MRLLTRPASICIAAILLTACSVTVRRDADAHDIAGAEAEIRPLLAEMLAAANAHDTDRHLAYYVRSPDLAFIVNDETIRGFDSLRVRQRQWWLDGKSDALYELVGVPDYRVPTPGIVMQTYVLKSTRSVPGGGTRAATIGVSSLWQKRPEGWRIVYTHEAVVPR